MTNFDKLWLIYPQGIYKDTLNLYNLVIEQKNTTHDNRLVDNKLLLEKYTEYSEWWKSRFGKLKPEYINIAGRKFTIYEFLLKEQWNASYVIETSDTIPMANELTKREYFAGLAMQGICVNVGRNMHNWNKPHDIALDAIRIADELLKQLEQKEEPK
jgi:hypothetical protein